MKKENTSIMVVPPLTLFFLFFPRKKKKALRVLAWRLEVWSSWALRAAEFGLARALFPFIANIGNVRPNV